MTLANPVLSVIANIHILYPPASARLCVSVLAALLATGCGNLKKSRKNPPPPAPADEPASSPQGTYRKVGEIIFVNLSAGFVLIQTPQSLSLKPGDSLFSGPLKAFTAALKVSPERKKQFTAADIANGDPSVNDPVYRFDKPEAPPDADAGAEAAETVGKKAKEKAKTRPKADKPTWKLPGWFRGKKKKMDAEEPADTLPETSPDSPPEPPSADVYAPAPTIPLPQKK